MTAQHIEPQASTVDDYGLDLAAVYHHVRPYLTGVRDVPVLGSVEWCALADTDRRKLAALIVAALARLVDGPDPVADAADREIATRQKETALDLAEATDWTHTGPTSAELDRRRAQPGPGAHTVDPEAAARWVATGTSTDRRSAA